MGIVLSEGAHPHQPVQGTRGLVAVAGAELGHPERQIAVAVQALVEDLHVGRAVHRLEREGLVLGLEREHVLAELLPVAGGFPERPIEQLGRPHLDIASGIETAPDIALDLAIESPAFGVPERRAGGFLLEVEQVELPAEPAVIAPLGLLEAMQIVVELLSARPGRAIDALQHGVAAVATPIGARRAWSA